MAMRLPCGALSFAEWAPRLHGSRRCHIRVQESDLAGQPGALGDGAFGDRKSTRLNSSHPSISYAVFCLKKKINTVIATRDARLFAKGGALMINLLGLLVGVLLLGVLMVVATKGWMVSRQSQDPALEPS